MKHRMKHHTQPAAGHFLLSVWCTARKAWQDLPERFASPGEAERRARDRGIFRVVFVCEGRRLSLEPFALVGDDDAEIPQADVTCHPGGEQDDDALR